MYLSGSKFTSAQCFTWVLRMIYVVGSVWRAGREPEGGVAQEGFLKEVGLGWVLSKGEHLSKQRGDDLSRLLPAQGLSDFAGSICHPHPYLHLSHQGPKGWKLKSCHLLE